jgi:transposase InsO family protein
VPSGGITRSSFDHSSTHFGVRRALFSTLKTELIHRQPWATRRETKDAVAEYIEGFYNPYRSHSSLGYVSPNDFERRHARQVQRAA